MLSVIKEEILVTSFEATDLEEFCGQWPVKMELRGIDRSMNRRSFQQRRALIPGKWVASSGYGPQPFSTPQ
jgi:hypothetical protein